VRHLNRLVLAGVLVSSVAFGGDQEPLRAGVDVPVPKLVKHVAPSYPHVARQAGVEGVVLLEVLANEQGRVAEIKVLRGTPILDGEAIEAVKHWTYEPRSVDGMLRQVWIREMLDFFADRGSAVRFFSDAVKDAKKDKALRVYAARQLAASGTRNGGALKALAKAPRTQTKPSRPPPRKPSPS